MKLKSLFLSLFSGLLLALAWPVSGLNCPYPLLFLAWVPLLLLERNIAEDQYRAKGLRFFNYAYLGLFTWNILVTWWVYNASLGGAAMAIICNSFLMALVLLLFHVTRKKAGNRIGYFGFVVYWLGFEYFHMNWDLSWPWLTLGNAFAASHSVIQWYEYTGVLGGSLWVLLMNLLVFDLYTRGRNNLRLSAIIGLALLPVAISFLVKRSYSDMEMKSDGKVSAVVIQPNIDPYTEKFNGLSAEEQLMRLLNLAEKQIDSTTDYIVGPETALVDNIFENDMSKDPTIRQLKDFLAKHPRVQIVTGASTMRIYEPGETVSETARKWRSEQEYFYDSYNTALQIDRSDKVQVYHKSKLVPGVEKMPFPGIFKYFEKFAIDLGGTSGSLGMQPERSVFTSLDKKTVVAPIICYESVYGEYVGEYVRKGANLLMIVTNDGWWEDTPGYKQHLAYGTLRAIETRKSIVRSANTGISCFISPMGEISGATGWWVPAVIKASVPVYNGETFYTRYGDYLGRVALLAALGLIAYLLLLRFRLIKKS